MAHSSAALPQGWAIKAVNMSRETMSIMAERDTTLDIVKEKNLNGSVVEL